MNPTLIAEWIASSMKTRALSLEQAADEFKRGGLPSTVVDEAARIVHARLEAVRRLRRPATMSRAGFKDWYPGPSDDDPFWGALKRYLLNGKGWPEPVVNAVDVASTRIVSQLEAPGEGQFMTRGLVLGYVQSGKTANFTGVIAKAADCGYQLFIVLSGIHNALRNQTQARLERELVEQKPDLWHALTSKEQDFRSPGSATAYLSERSNQRVLCVMKKNATVLRKVLRWLRSASRTVLEQCPVLIIDDEADQASIDTQGTEDPSIINRLILDLLRVFPKSAYVAYTATPFANILSDTSSRELLYPRDFIVDLPRSEAYFGAERLFGTGITDQGTGDDDSLDMIRMVPLDEEPLLKPPGRDARETFDPALTRSLEDALLWFWIACAVRRLRGQADQHMSMLVHTTLYTEQHRLLTGKIEVERRRVAGALRNPTDPLRERVAAMWADEAERAADEEPGALRPSADEIWSTLPAVLSACKTVTENAQSQVRLSFPEGGSTQIVVGGNTLSRGLTIEGLMVSYFVRASTYYDTLLQMGRWFGYRPGYADLPRIWMTAQLQDAFQHLARVESEIREDIALYEREGMTPVDFAPRIQTHSTLAVTSPLKMRYAVQASMSYDLAVKQTTYFHHRDAGWLRQNAEAARALLLAAHRLRRPERVWGRHVLYRDIPVQDVLELLGRYQIHDRHEDMRPGQLAGYIRSQNQDGRLTRWNVGVISQERAPTPDFEWTGLLPERSPVNLIRRERLKNEHEPDTANVKALMGKVDRALDFGLAEAPTETPSGFDTFVAWTKARRSPAETRGVNPATGQNMPLLLLYPIARSSAQPDSPSREPLDAVDHVVGLAMLFPKAAHLTPQGYVTADLSRTEQGAEVLDMDVSDEEYDEGGA